MNIEEIEARVTVEDIAIEIYKEIPLCMEYETDARDRWPKRFDLLAAALADALNKSQEWEMNYDLTAAILHEREAEIAALRFEYIKLIFPLYTKEEEIAALRREVETLNLKLAGCGVAAMQNTEKTIKQRIDTGNPYYSASYGDVCDAGLASILYGF
jgi:hypothetical protein